MRSPTLLSAALATAVCAQTPPGFKPASNVQLPVSYGNLKISPGDLVAHNVTTTAPTIRTSNSTLTLLLDLDAPTSQDPKFSPLLHWIMASPNQTVVQYLPPNPPANSSAHRYVFLSYTLPASNSTVVFTLPPGFEDVGVDQDPAKRVLFDLEGFTEAAGLEELQSANWFQQLPKGVGNETSASKPPQQYEGGADGLSTSIAIAVVTAIGVCAGGLL